MLYDTLVYRYLLLRRHLAATVSQEDGVETLEVIAIMAILIILLGALAAIFNENARTIAQNVIQGIIEWSEGVRGGG